ncbi:hypothetical protein [Pendulispora albinea]|uniref:Uncharacterized protein n=1 Tax=Pendulispora albinea TaxID=2741071 RepID=A0ABZ2MA68_9BACT
MTFGKSHFVIGIYVGAIESARVACEGQSADASPAEAAPVADDFAALRADRRYRVIGRTD